MEKQKVFISSVQKEFQKERMALYNHFLADALLSSFFEPVLFEKLPANHQAPNKVYLNEVANSKVFIILLGKTYGYEDENGISPTELEYNYAKELHKTSFAFIKGSPELERHSKEQTLLSKVQNHVTYKSFETVEQLIAEIDTAFVQLLKQQGLIHHIDFDAAFNTQAAIVDIDAEKVNNFIGLARAKRGFPLREGTPVIKVLSHLNMLINNQLTYSALLAFGTDPQRFTPSAIVKCAHFHGFKVEKPIPDHRVIKNDVFTQVDEAIDFVLSKISVSVGLRNESNQAPVKYEIPRAVVAEAIVNAIAHREYYSNASVQVMLFADRLEISNPGSLPPELSLEKLKTDHSSYPTNPKLAEVLYQAGYIERFGTGTGEIFRLTKEAGLKEPVFNLEEGFKVTIWRPIVPIAGQATGQATTTGTLSNVKTTGQATGQATGQVSNPIHKAVLVITGEVKRNEIQEALELKHRDYFMDNYLNPAIEQGYIEQTIPDKPTSPKQKYRLTEKGLKLKNELEKN